MLTVDRRQNSTMNSSRIYRGVPKPAVDFLARNKRAIRKKEPKSQSQKTHSELNKPNTKQVSRGPEAKTGPQDANTVVISKRYLEDLLRMGVVPQKQEGLRKDVTHVQLESNQVPGLESLSQTVTAANSHTVTAPQPARPQIVTDPHPHSTNAPQPSQTHTVTAVQTTNQPHALTAKEQWLRDLAEQVKEKKEREKNRSTNKTTTEEVYFPFGRPGCGAPIRTDSGQVIADLRSKIKVGSNIEGPVYQIPSKPDQVTFSQTEEYFPFGRPGCGAPNNTSGHGVSYQPYGGDTQHGSHLVGSYPPPQTLSQQPPPPAVQPQAHHHSSHPHHPSSHPHNVSSHPHHPSSHPHNASSHPHHPYYHPYPHQLSMPPDSQHNPAGQSGPVTHPTHSHPHNRPPQSVTSHPISTNALAVQASSMVSPRDGFKRGAGPYVDKFVRQDMDQRKRKDLEYRAELAEQIAAQRRDKEAQRLAKEREEAVEEARLAQERERLNKQYQREVFEKRRKEELAMQRHRMLQQGIEQAKQKALIAKIEAKGATHPTLSTHSPTHATHTVHSHNNLSVSSKFDSVMRSPSMLQLQEIPTDTENSKKTSRIPVRRPRPHNPTQRKEGVPSHRTRQPTLRGPSPPVPTLAKRQGHTANRYTTGSGPTPQLTLPTVTRPVSPPVPTLAKKMSQCTLPAKTATPTLREGVGQGMDIVRSQSPPVPTLAKRMSRDQQASDVKTLSQSPSVPTVVRNHNGGSVEQPCLEGGTIPINRLPSCEPEHDDSPPTLPAIVPVFQDGGPSRQQVILEQLAALKKGILSHQSTIDQRVNLIMARRKPNF